MTIILNTTGNPITREERIKINQNWDRIVGGLTSLQFQINTLAGEDVEKIIERINQAIQEVTDAKNKTDEAIRLANKASTLANSSATDANLKAQEAQEATRLANEATVKANEASATLNATLESINTAIAELNLAKQDTITATELANQATQNVTQAANAKIIETEETRLSLVQDAEATKQKLLNDAQLIETQLTESIAVTKQDLVLEVNNAKADAVAATNAANTAATSATDAANAVAGWSGAVVFNQGKVYSKNNVVTFNGSTYQAKKDGVYSTPPTPPVDNEDWTVIALRGVDGEGSVSSVNGISPDATGNVTLPLPEGTVKAVNGQTPNRAGNITLFARDVDAYTTVEVNDLLATNKKFFTDKGYGTETFAFYPEDVFENISTTGIYYVMKNGLNEFLPPEPSARYTVFLTVSNVSINNGDGTTTVKSARMYRIIEMTSGKIYDRNIALNDGVKQADTGWVLQGSSTDIDGSALKDGTVTKLKLSADVQQALDSAGQSLTATTDNVNKYVNSRTGSDTTGNGTNSAPYATITRAVQDMPDIINHVFQITVYYGDYVENVTVPAKLGSGSIIIRASDTVNTKMFGVFTFSGFAGKVECTGFSFVLGSTGSTPITYTRCIDATSTNITVDASAYTGAQQKWAIRCLYGTNLYLNTLTVNSGNATFTCLEMQGTVRAVVAKASGTTGIGFDAKNGALIELGNVTGLTTTEPSRTTNYGRVITLTP